MFHSGDGKKKKRYKTDFYPLTLEKRIFHYKNSNSKQVPIRFSFMCDQEAS